MKWFKRQEDKDKTCGYLDETGKFYRNKADRDSKNRSLKVDRLKRQLVNSLESAATNVQIIDPNHNIFHFKTTENFIDALVKGNQLDNFFHIYEDYKNAVAKLYNDENS